MKLITSLYYRLYIIYLATKWIFQTNLGNEVIYKNKRYIVTNGVVSNCWTITSDDDEHSRLEYIPHSECKLVLSPSNLLSSFRFGYNFYMRSWFSIWCNGGIKPWMKALPIWGTKNK